MKIKCQLPGKMHLLQYCINVKPIKILHLINDHFCDL